jgi:hypothetical protein
LFAVDTVKLRPEPAIFCGRAGEIETPAGKELESTETVPLKPFLGCIAT